MVNLERLLIGYDTRFLCKRGQKHIPDSTQDFTTKEARNTSQIPPKTLLQTSAAAKFHGLHIYNQVQQWKGEEDARRMRVEGE